MPDLAESCEVAHRVHDVVGSSPSRFVDDERAVVRRGLRLACHAFTVCCWLFSAAGLWQAIHAYDAAGLSFFISFRSFSIRSLYSWE